MTQSTNGQTKDPLLGNAGEISLFPSQPKIVAPKTPDDYKGNPYLYIPNIEYETHIRSHLGEISAPLLSPHIQQKLDEMYIWAEDDKMMTKEGPTTKEEYTRMRLDIIAEGFSDLDMAKYLILVGYPDDKYVKEYAQKALNANPNDYQTLYVWTQAQTEQAKRVIGYRKLFEQNPNSSEILFFLGTHLAWEGKTRGEAEKAIDYLKRSAALDPKYLRGEAYRVLGGIYLGQSDSDTALAFYKRAQEIYHWEVTQENIERIEKGELQYPVEPSDEPKSEDTQETTDTNKKK